MKGIKKYCLTYEYPGICWTYLVPNSRNFFECDKNYKMLSIPIKEVVKLHFKYRIHNPSEYGIDI